MKYKLLNRAIRKQNKKHPRESRFVSYEKAHSILLLFDGDGSDEAIRRIIGQLRHDKKEVAAWAFCDAKPIPGNTQQQDVHVFYRKDTGLFQKPRRHIVQEVKGKSYDLLINLSADRSVPLLYLALFAQATLKAGRETPFRLFDFMLDVGKHDEEGHPIDAAYLFEKIIFYLKSIQTSD